MGIVEGIIGALGGITEAGLNYQSQVANLDYQKNLQKQIFAREDNAVSRRAADLKNAGLSKTLAAGDAAGDNRTKNHNITILITSEITETTTRKVNSLTSLITLRCYR